MYDDAGGTDGARVSTPELERLGRRPERGRRVHMQGDVGHSVLDQGRGGLLSSVRVDATQGQLRNPLEPWSSSQLAKSGTPNEQAHGHSLMLQRSEDPAQLGVASQTAPGKRGGRQFSIQGSAPRGRKAGF